MADDNGGRSSRSTVSSWCGSGSDTASAAAARRWLVIGVGDTELHGVLELSVRVLDQLKTVMSGVGFQVGFWGPLEGTAVWNLLSDGIKRLDVGGWATEEDDGDGSGLGWLPGNLEWRADRDNLGACWSEDWVGGNIEAGWSGECECTGRGSEDADDGCEGRHFVYFDLSYCDCCVVWSREMLRFQKGPC